MVRIEPRFERFLCRRLPVDSSHGGGRLVSHHSNLLATAATVNSDAGRLAARAITEPTLPEPMIEMRIARPLPDRRPSNRCGSVAVMGPTGPVDAFRDDRSHTLIAPLSLRH